MISAAFRSPTPSTTSVVDGQTARERGSLMGKVLAGITVSVDGYITGPNDGPDCGPGVGGERLHYWVFGGPWGYGSPHTAARTL
jgi:hypothetical protein